MAARCGDFFIYIENKILYNGFIKYYFLLKFNQATFACLGSMYGIFLYTKRNEIL